MITDRVPGAAILFRCRLQDRTARFLRSEDGSATIESLIWFLAFFGFLGLVTDASMAFFGRAQAFRILQDGNRAYATGRLTSMDALETWIDAAIAPVSAEATVTSEVSNGIVRSQLNMPLSSLELFGMIPGSGTVTVVSSHYVE